ncbi:MAG: NYN domain-containing protein [Chloroflexota bacterium]
MGDRVFIFIDGSNLEMAAKATFDKGVFPEALAKKLVGERRLMGVNYYEAPLWPDVNRGSYDAQQRFFDRLRKNPYFDVRLGRRVKRDKVYKCPECSHEFSIPTYEQKGVDALIAFDLVALAIRNAYDIAILVSGDQDFVCSILEVRRMDKIVESAFTEQAWSPILKSVADATILLDSGYLEGCFR